MNKKDDWVVCPHCGGEIKRSATACRHCGSDDRTGWSEGTYMDGIDIPDEDDYEDSMEREGFRKQGPKGRRRSGSGRSEPGPNRLVMGLVSALLVLIFVGWLLRSVF